MCSGALAELLIVSESIHQRLLCLYNQDCMSLSIKLMILRALDASLRNKVAVQHFLVLRTSIPRVNGLKLADKLKAKVESLKVNVVAEISEKSPSSDDQVQCKSFCSGSKDDTPSDSGDVDKIKGITQKKGCDDKSEAVNEFKDIIKVDGSLSEDTSKENLCKTLLSEENSTRTSDELESVPKSGSQNTTAEQLEVDLEARDSASATMKGKAGILFKGDKLQKCEYKKVHVTINGKKLVRLLKKKPALNSATYVGINGYQALLLMFKAEKLSRTKFALCNLIRKIHVYEVLEKFKSTVKSLATSNNASNNHETFPKKHEGIDCGLKTFMNSSVLNGSSESDVVDTIVSCLFEITSVFQQAPLMLAQPKRFLPGHAQFDFGACSHEAHRSYPALFSFLHCHRFVECCNVLLTSPQTMNCNIILGPLYDAINTIADSQEGLLYLATHIDATNILLRILLQQSSSEELLDESTLSHSSSHYLGVHLAYRLQAVHFIDQILEAMSTGKPDPERQEIFDNLMGLYYLSFSNFGKTALVHVVSCGDFTKIFLDLLNYNSPETDSKYRKYPGKNFVDDLITSVVKFSDSGLFLKRFGPDILKAARNVNSKLHEVVPYLQVIDNLQLFSYDDISPLCDVVKKNIEMTASFPGELITALRVLKYLAVPSQATDSVLDNNANYQYSYMELKYKYVVLELFSLDGVSHMTAILSRICDAYEQPALHGSTFLGVRGAIVTSIILPALELLRQMLTLVIQCRNTDFRDLTSVNILLQTYTLLHAFPSNSLAYEAAQKGCREVIETLLAFTQPVQPESSSEKEGLNKSLWTLMMAEVLKYILTNAHTFMSGLHMLSEVLPLPLPVQTRMPLHADEVGQTISSRKLWCAHLHSLSSIIGDLIATLCGSSCPSLLQLLRRVCMQLSDLAAPTALVVARSVLDTVSLSFRHIL